MEACGAALAASRAPGSCAWSQGTHAWASARGEGLLALAAGRSVALSTRLARRWLACWAATAARA